MADKAKVPALAAGVGLAGLAGGVALGSRNSQKRIVRMPVPRGTKAVSKNLAEATENVRSFGQGMGRLAQEVSKIREGFARAGSEDARGEPKKPSPIEVVLQGLTRRR